MGGPLNQRLYAEQDVNGNVTSVVNTSGTVVERFTYNPYGAVTVLTPTWTTTAESLAWQYLYQGGRFDSTVGLYDFRNRDYSPNLGRWITNDPLGFNAGDTNTYRFVGNNPATENDPSGLIAPALALGLAGAIIGGVGGGMTTLYATWYNPFTWDPKRVLAGAIAGALIGAGLGLGFAGAATLWRPHSAAQSERD